MSEVMSAVPEDNRRRKSLVLGEARRERFPHSRQGTGRVPTVRPLGALGKKDGIVLDDAERHGLVNLHQMFALELLMVCDLLPAVCY